MPREINLEWNRTTGEVTPSEGYRLKRNENVTFIVQPKTARVASTFATGWALVLTLKVKGNYDDTPLLAVTSWTDPGDGTYTKTVQISSSQIDAALEADATLTDDLAEVECVADLNLSISGGAPEKSDTIAVTLQNCVSNASDGTPTSTAVAITASGYTMSTARLLGRSTASTGAIEELATQPSSTFLGGGIFAASGNVSLASRGTYIVPVQRNSATPLGEKLGIMVTYDNFATLTDLFSGDLFTEPTNKGVRDPVLIRYNGVWYCAYTYGDYTAASLEIFGVAYSTDLQTWTHLQNVTITESLNSIWGPRWFRDDITGKLFFIVTFAPDGNPGSHVPYCAEVTALSTSGVTVGTWTAMIGLPSWFYDLHVERDAKYYYAIGNYTGTAPTARIYRSTSLTSGWTLFDTPVLNATYGVEQLRLYWLGGKNWRVTYYTNPELKNYQRISNDGMATWGDAFMLYDTGADATKRSFVQIIEWPPIRDEMWNASLAGGSAASGTVTTVSITTANGISGTVANATTTPAITLSLGNITPTRVNIDGGAAPATQQLNLKSNGDGAMGMLSYSADNCQLYFDLEWTAGALVSRSGNSCGMWQKVGNALQLVGKASTQGGAVSFGVSDVHFGVNVTTGVVTINNLTASSAVATNANKELVSITNTGTGNNVLATSPTLVTPALGAATATSITLNSGVTPSEGQMLIQANGSGAIAIYEYVVNDGGILFEAKWTGANFAATATSSAFIRKGDGLLTILGAAGHSVGAFPSFSNMLQFNLATLGATFSGTLTASGTIELGHANDTTLSRVSAGVIAVEGATLAKQTDITGGTLAGSFTTLTASSTVTLNGLAYTFPASQTANYYLKTNGSGTLTWAAATGGSTNAWIGAAEMIPRTTNGCGVNSSETGTNDVNYDTMDFDAGTTNEGAQFWRVLPNNWNAGTITAKFYWTADSGSGDVIFKIAARTMENDTALDTAFGTAESATDTVLATGDMHISPATSAITIAGTPANGTPIVFEITRDSGTDSLAFDARLIGVELTYTAS